MPRRLPFPLAAALALLVAACATRDLTREATHLAALYVTADTLGDRDSADSLVAPCDSAGEQLPVEPVSGVALRRPYRGTTVDTIVVLAIYRVLGTAHSEDPTTVGALNWRFEALPHTDTTILRMAPDSAGRLWIACGPFAANHRSLSQMSEEVKLMDSTSRAALEFAKTGVAPPPPPDSE